ncbi:MAG: 3-dehydroquinate synthase [Trueperaceae bacterium]|nr:3-dehydroquinate synthase [Trueperaceae bacterium]
MSDPRGGAAARSGPAGGGAAPGAAPDRTPTPSPAPVRAGGVAGSLEVVVAVAPHYTVSVGPDLLTSLLPARVGERRVALVTDARVAAHHARRVSTALAAAGKDVLELVVPAGEASKSLGEYARLLGELASVAFPRDGAVVALGGGVVGDLGGFVAASYMRGVAFYQAPTSLLAMVDASVGGKTGIDLPQGKNLVGAFWQPRTVIADVGTLATLPEREFRQGTVEAFKHALLAAPDLLPALTAGWGTDAATSVLTEVVARNVAVKAAVVAADEREQGVRAHLNLGHTLAHALEAASGHTFQHGDAVAYGLVFAALVARARGFADVLRPTLDLLGWVAPAPLPNRAFGEVRPFMARDKKVVDGRLRMVLLEEVGRAVVVADLREGELAAAWNELLEVTA